MARIMMTRFMVGRIARFLILSATIYGTAEGCLAQNKSTALHVLTPKEVKRAYMNRHDTISLCTYNMFGTSYYCEPGTYPLGRVGGMTLPPSRFAWFFEDQDKGYHYYPSLGGVPVDYKNMPRILCWMGLVDGDTVREAAIRDSLCRLHYKALYDIEKGIIGIAATWVTGNIHFIYNPSWRFGMWYAMRDGSFYVNGGIYETEPEDPVMFWDIFHYNKSRRTYSLFTRVYDLAPETTIWLDGTPHGYISHRRMMLILLANDIYTRIDPRGATLSTYSYMRNVPIYIYMKRNGKADMALLDDTPYDRDQLARLRQLRKAVQRLPPMMFGPEYTTQGILPGMILYADYSFDTWIFREE